jgi:hypothetical protein
MWRGVVKSTRQITKWGQFQPDEYLASLSEISKLGWNNYYEAVLTKQGGEQLAKPKTVYIFLKEKQLIIKEYYLKIIPHRLVRQAGRKNLPFYGHVSVLLPQIIGILLHIDLNGATSSICY